MVKAWETGNTANQRTRSYPVPVLAGTYIITVIPCASGTVTGPAGQENEEIICTEGSLQAQCQEPYQSERGITLKAEREPGWVLLEWAVNGQMVETENNIIEISGDADVAGIFEQQTVFLTFDDGPLPGTDDVIRILREEGGKGTFFMAGVHNISTWRSDQIRDADQYFEIGNHSYSHPWTAEDVTAYYTGLPEVVLDDFQDNDTELSNTLNLSPVQQFVQARLPTKNTWRIPGIPPITDGTGGTAANLLHDPNGYDIYGWDVLWERDGVHPRENPGDMAEIVENALANQLTKKKNKIIVLMHDDMFKQSEGDDVKLRQFVQILKDKGYRFDYISNY